MAGMLPGVECARRRRFHQGGSSDSHNGVGKSSGTRRSSFCLYTSSHETHHLSSNSLQRRGAGQGIQTEKLGDIAREARDRLDEKLKTNKQSHTERRSSEMLKREKMSHEEEGVQTVKRRWGRLMKWEQQQVCGVCLEGIKEDEILVVLTCTHRFHSSCLLPWLEAHPNCPYCRTQIFKS